MLRKCAWGVLLLSAAAIFAAGFGVSEEPAVYMPGNSRDVVRLHVIANSDSQLDQLVQLKVRDAIIAYMAPKLKKVTNSTEAAAVIAENRRDMEEVARRVLLLSGIAYPVQVEYGQFSFPVRTYGDTVYPAGKYNAVRILLGQAQGSNWWCVLFPPLCFIDGNGVYTVKAAETKLDQNSTKRIELRWKIFEVFAR